MPIIEIYNDYADVGVNARQITKGEEFEMVSSFLDYRKQSFKEKPEKQLAIFLETKINNAYPDIVFAEYNPFLFEKWSNSRDKLNLFDIKLLYYIYSTRYVTTKKIIKTLSVSYRELLCSIEKLLDADLIIRQKGYWIMHNRNVFGVKNIEAFEAKINNWEKVMQQALINKSFASESFILTKKKTEPNPGIVQKTMDFGIGLYICTDKGFSKVSAAQKRKFPINYNSIYINEFIGRILNKS